MKDYWIKIYISLAVLLIAFLHFYSSFYPSFWNWGFDHLKYFSPNFRIIFFVFVVISLIPFINNRICSAISYFYSKLNSLKKIKLPGIQYYIVPLIFFLLFWTFRTNRFYGDYWLEGARLETSSIYPTNPLYDYINHAIYAVTKLIGMGRFETIALASVLYGCLGMFFLFKLASETTKEKLEKFFIIAILGTMGTIQLFFGNVEVEASIATGTIIYIYLAYLSLKKNYSILYPTLALSITIMLKMSTVTFLPSLLYLYYVKYGQKIGFRCFFKKDFLKLIVVFVIPIIITFSTVYFYTWKGNPPKNDADKYGSLYAFWCYQNICAPLPLNILFSKTHLIETFNEHILFSPLGLVILLFFLIAGRKSMKEYFFIFLLFMSIFSLLWGFTWVHSYDYKESWELASISSIPYTLLASLLLIKNYNKSLRYLFLIIIILYLFHTLPWILSNSLAYSYHVNEELKLVEFIQINKYIV